jgi:hypothetical protein
MPDTKYYINQDDWQMLDAQGCLVTYDVPLRLVQFDDAAWQHPVNEWINYTASSGSGQYIAASFTWQAKTITGFDNPLFLYVDDRLHGGEALIGAWWAPADGGSYQLSLPYMDTWIGYTGGAYQLAPCPAIPEPSTYGVILSALFLGIVLLRR